MTRSRLARSWPLLLALLSSCAPPRRPPQMTTEHALAPLDVDPVEHAASPEAMRRLTDSCLRTARARLDEIRALASAPDEALTVAATLGKLDEATLAIRNAGDFAQLVAVAHPTAAVRDAAKEAEPKVDELSTALLLDAELARVFRRLDARHLELTGPERRLLEHTLRDFRRNGLELPPEGQARLRALNEQLTQLGQAFETNIAEDTRHVDLPASALAGLPRSFVDAHPPREDGKVRLTTDYPDYLPFMQYATDRQAALALYKEFDNRASSKNVAVLDRLLSLRHDKARLLGYATWADFVLETRMAKTPAAVSQFLSGLRAHLDARARREMAELREMLVTLGGKADDPIPPSDRVYLEDQVKRAKYGVDSKEVSKYFEVSRVQAGVLELTSRLFGLRYQRLDAVSWHPDVEAYLVTDTHGAPLGRFYFDLYPRADKYKHAAVFSVRETRKMSDGSRLLPIAAIVCNFPRSKPGAPALLTHGEVTTFLHEFGHVLHHLLSESALASFAGTAVARDFVEAPSQMLEEWAWSKETLDVLALHHETGAKLPDDLFDKMRRARGFGRAIATQRQLFLAALDQAYHTRPPGLDTTAVLREIHDSYTPFKYVEGTHFQATFGHLVGYDAGYYGYQWALSIARDLFSRFEREGMMNPKTAADYRAAILAPGGSDDEARLVERFLGRPSSDEAYKRFLGAD